MLAIHCDFCTQLNIQIHVYILFPVTVYIEDCIAVLFYNTCLA